MKNSIETSSKFALPALKRPNRYGIYRWWPQNDDDWVHPDDRGIVDQLVPGTRVFCRQELESDYAKISYGPVSFRAKATIWFEVRHEGFDIGNCVEIKSRMGRAEPRLAHIKEMIWNQKSSRIEYFLIRSGKMQVRPYVADDLALVESIQRLDATQQSEVQYNLPRMGGSLPRT